MVYYKMFSNFSYESFACKVKNNSTFSFDGKSTSHTTTVNLRASAILGTESIFACRSCCEYKRVSTRDL